jgi:hypothetical protein
MLAPLHTFGLQRLPDVGLLLFPKQIGSAKALINVVNCVLAG